MFCFDAILKLIFRKIPKVGENNDRWDTFGEISKELDEVVSQASRDLENLIKQVTTVFNDKPSADISTHLNQPRVQPRGWYCASEQIDFGERPAPARYLIDPKMAEEDHERRRAIRDELKERRKIQNKTIQKGAF